MNESNFHASHRSIRTNKTEQNMIPFRLLLFPQVYLVALTLFLDITTADLLWSQTIVL